MFDFELGFEDIRGYEGLYKINRHGQIWSCRRKFFIIHRQGINSYYYISLTKEGNAKHYLIHRLLALQYIKNPNKLPVIDHIDMVKTNNTIENLRWVSHSDNRENQTKHKDNSSGFKHIVNVINKLHKYWKIKIENKKIIFRRCYNKEEYTLAQVVSFRNEIYKELNIKQYD